MVVTLNWLQFVYHGKGDHSWTRRLLLLLASVLGINPKKCPSLGQIVKVNLLLLMLFVVLITPWILLYLTTASLMIIIGGNSLPNWLNANDYNDNYNIMNVTSYDMLWLN